mgnify:CR=1 FL=1
MSEISSVSSGSPATAQAASQAVTSLLKKTLEMQKESIQQLLSAMGIGQNVDAEA